MITLKNINTAIVAAETIITTYKIMVKTFKWFEKHHGNNNKTNLIRPIIKGI